MRIPFVTAFNAAALGTLLLAGIALAQQPAPDPLRVIVDEQTALARDLASGNTRGMTPRQVLIVRGAQKEVFAAIDGRSSLAELSIDEKVKLENALERINAQVVGTRAASESQDVCWREAKSGSKLMVTRCGTQEERDEARRGARAWMDKPKVCVPPGCGS